MHVATFLQDLAGGGAERVAVLLMNGLVARGERVTLILARLEGPYLDDLDPAIELVDLGNRRSISSIRPLARWLRSARPDILVSHLTHVNVAAALANRLARAGIPHVAVEHNQMGQNYALLTNRSVKAAYRLARFVYPGISRIVSVSQGVEAAVLAFTRGRAHNHQVIHNPVVTDGLVALSAEAPEHRWLADGAGIPVLLGCGRLHHQKGFDVLISAVRKVLDDRPVRLVILGEGPLRPQLEAQIIALNLGDHVDLAGFSRNPFAMMRAADAFILSSRWEGLPTVLIEALACGANIVATDCPSGPLEVLEEGKFGRLVPVDDSHALAGAIYAALDTPLDSVLATERASDFTLDRAVDNYMALFEHLQSRPGKQTKG